MCKNKDRHSAGILSLVENKSCTARYGRFLIPATIDRKIFCNYLAWMHDFESRPVPGHVCLMTLYFAANSAACTA